VNWQSADQVATADSNFEMLSSKRRFAGVALYRPLIHLSESWGG
jgi:hypothetical protein